MKEEKIYAPETAADLYEQLQEAYRQKEDIRKAYFALNRLFQKCLFQNTRIAGVRFSGSFSKTDYLLKENNAPRALQRSVNAARIHLRRQNNLREEELKGFFDYDFKAVCQLVALVYQAPVPATLEVLFPQDDVERPSDIKAQWLRVIVSHWDDVYLYAHADQDYSDEVKIHYGGKSPHAVYQDWDWSYLRSLLKEGCQLNIIRPRTHEGVLYPELFIWEPDYLVDISAIAACFETFGASPYLHLLNKLKPQPNTSAILLGNLASQFLDDLLNASTEESTYAESVMKFFKTNAFSLLTADIDKDFHTQAQRQRQIIKDTLEKKLPALNKKDGIRYDASEIMVEPSFFSEMLGLQGRMDFLQLDYKVLIEQKSGKGGFPQRDPETPFYQEKHYIQLLLYMLLIRYNFHEAYEKNHHQLHPLLLYSKYQNGLIRLGFAPDLIFAAIKMRNEIVAQEYRYTQQGLSILTRLTPDLLNTTGTAGTLWERYQKPQIEALLAPIHSATPLERAYYLRFLTFIETEHLLSKVGNQSKENSGFADKWYSTLEDKLAAGNIYSDLQLVSPSPSEKGRVDQVTLEFTDHEGHEISNFRPGDIVILYPYPHGEEPDARQTMVFRSTIVLITDDHIVLNLRATQTNAQVFWYHGKMKWAIEHDLLESSFTALYRGMHTFLSAPKERRDLLLLQRVPRQDKTIQLSGEYGSFNTLVLKTRQARDLFLIIGPPGTGKTSYGLLNTLKEELISTQGNVLLLAYTNRAVDEICGKLVDDGIDFIRIGGTHTCEEAHRPYLLSSKVEGCQQISQLKTIIDHTRVFVGTTASLQTHLPLFHLKQFSLAIIDEASQILEPHLLGLLCATTSDGCCAIQKIVMIGDHKQLPAVVQQQEEESEVTDPLLRHIHLTNCRLSLFERLLRQYRDNPDVVQMLTRQGRMHHDIAEFPSKAFYKGQLKEVPLPHQHVVLPPPTSCDDEIESILRTRRVFFIAISPTGEHVSDKVNTSEARAIAAYVVKIYQLTKSTFDPLQTVGVIVPYRNQIAEVRNCIQSYGVPALRDITIDTVERYQGSQRDYIIYGFTIQKYYQLEFLTSQSFVEEGSIIDRKLNVAMTRAREHLIMIGNPALLSRNYVFRQLIAYTKAKGCYC